MEDEESLQAGALLRLLPQPLEHEVDDLLADGVVASCVVVRRVLLPGHQLLGVEERAINSRPGFVDHGRLKVDKDGSRDVLAVSLKKGTPFSINEKMFAKTMWCIV